MPRMIAHPADSFLAAAPAALAALATDCSNDIPSAAASRRARHARRGTTTVEFALVALPLFLFVFASVEFGRGLMAINSLEEAARAGCRAAILKDASPADIQTEVDTILSLNGIDSYDMDYEPKPLASATQWAPITVRVSATFGEMSWLPMPRSLAGVTYTASATLPKEARRIVE